MSSKKRRTIMKKLSSILSAIILVMLVGFAGSTFADTYVQGYTRKDGTYVQPHYRSSPDKSRSNNWSSKGNVNPYTGKKGYRDRYAPKRSRGYRQKRY